MRQFRSIKRAKCRTRKKNGELNKTEQAYADVLASKMANNEILGFSFESIKLKLADLTYYTPDFFVQMIDGSIEFHEVKACTRKGKVLVEDDARVKIKVAANQFPQFGFVVAAKLPVKSGGGWKFEVVS